ncbi:MAG: response regulator [Roseburia sp.]|nr:response regulator [Roseburia sp.]
MGKQEATGSSERVKETFILIMFTIYQLGAAGSFIMYDWNEWIPAAIVATIGVNWLVFWKKKIGLKGREAIYVMLTEVSIVIYGFWTEELTLLTVITIATAVITGLLSDVELLYITDIALVLLVLNRIFGHKAIFGDDMVAMYQTFLLFANIAIIEFIIHFWVSQRNKVDARTAEMILDLKEAERSKDDFLANVSHEIRTPINTICGMSEVALTEDDPAKIRTSLRAIQSAGRNLTSVVVDILDFSELQSGKMVIQNEVYNIASTINDVINMSMALKDKKPIELVVDCDANLPSGLYGDEKKIRRVIMNFVSNALKFTSEGSVKISVSGRKEAYGMNLCVSVTDTGIGIKEENLEKLFSSFNQVDTKRTRQEGGIGLGLALSQTIVQKMGGVITVKSKYGKGTTIQFVIPQKVVDEQPIISVKNREELNVAVYLNVEQFVLAEMRDDYVGAISHMIEQLQVRCQMCSDMASFKRRYDMDTFTHVFISLTEYREATEYFDKLSEQTKVAVVLDAVDMETVTNPKVILVPKPLYILPVVAVLNGEYASGTSTSPTSTKKFISPETRVLVVDDNWMNLKVIEGLLERYQIKVSTATNGPEALEKIESKEFDFIFMDHMMPDMDGVETLHRIRNKVGSYYKKVPIIAVTANAIAGSREMFIQEGFNDFLEKPIELSVLERLLRRNILKEKIQYIQDAEENDNLQTNVAQQTVEQPTKEESAPEPKKEELRVGDLDVEKGLLYCGGRASYLEILEQYCKNGNDHIAKIEALFETKDWKNYTIEVHALKSMMMSVGALPLSEQAKQLELAGKRGDVAWITVSHSAMITEYVRVLNEIREALGLPIEEEVDTSDCVEIDTHTMQSYIAELDTATFDFDGEKMLDIIGKMEHCSYMGQPMQKVIDTARRKVEMSDYMSALDGIIKWKEQAEKEGSES